MLNGLQTLFVLSRHLTCPTMHGSIRFEVHSREENYEMAWLGKIWTPFLVWTTQVYRAFAANCVIKTDSLSISSQYTQGTEGAVKIRKICNNTQMKVPPPPLLAASNPKMVLPWPERLHAHICRDNSEKKSRVSFFCCFKKRIIAPPPPLLWDMYLHCGEMNA